MGIVGIVEIELDAAAVGAERQHAIGLQAAGQDVQHRVRPDPVIERLAVAVEVVGAFQRTALQRVPAREFGHIAAVVEHPVQLRMDMWHVVTLKIIVYVDLPVAGNVVGFTPMQRIARQCVGADACIDAIEHVREWRRFAQRDEDEASPQRDARLRKADRADVEICRAAHFRCALQASIERICPAVVTAAQALRGASVANREGSGAVPADVVQRAQLTVVAAHDQERHPGDFRDDMVTVAIELCHVRRELPAAREHRAAIQSSGVARVVARGQCRRIGK